MAYQVTSFKAAPELLDLLRRAAAAQRMTQGAYLRRLIENDLSRTPMNDETRPVTAASRETRDHRSSISRDHHIRV